MISRGNYLLDTSIQVKRLISERWAKNRLDSIWKDVTPVASYYSLMEFKNSVIGSLKFLINVLNEILNQNNDIDNVDVRLNEVIMFINMDSNIRTTDRRVKLANAYASKLINENKLYPRTRGIKEVIEQLEIEADNLQSFWFFHFSANGIPKKMKIINSISCHLGNNINPLGKENYTCVKEKYHCKIFNFITQNNLCRLGPQVEKNEVKLNSSRLKKGIHILCKKINDNEVTQNLSIGQVLCWPIGDGILGLKAKSEDIGIMTGDKDIITIAEHLEIRSIFYDSKLITFI